MVGQFQIQNVVQLCHNCAGDRHANKRVANLHHGMATVPRYIGSGALPLSQGSSAMLSYAMLSCVLSQQGLACPVGGGHGHLRSVPHL